MKGEYDLMENMSIKSICPTLTPETLAIVSRIPKGKTGDPESLKALGIQAPHTEGPIEGLVRAMDRQDAIRARELDLLEKGLLPEDWALFQAWKYEISIGRLKLPDTLKEQYGNPLTWANYEEWLEGPRH